MLIMCDYGYGNICRIPLRRGYCERWSVFKVPKMKFEQHFICAIIFGPTQSDICVLVQKKKKLLIGKYVKHVHCKLGETTNAFYPFFFIFKL